MADLEISGREFENNIKENDVCVVDFFATWCMPCLMMEPILEELSEKFKGKIKFAKINVDDNPELSSKFGVFSIPTLIVFEKGKVAEKITGSLPIDVLEEKLKKHL